MSPINCVRCGCLNGTGADVCERCGTPLITARVAAAGVPVVTQANLAASGPPPPPAAYAAPAFPAGRLPIDFPSTPFQSVGDALRPTLQLYRENFVLVGKIVLAATPPLMVVQYALASYGEAWGWGAAVLGMLASSLVNSLMGGALVYAVVTLLRTAASPSLAESYGWGLRKWWPLFLCLLLSNILTGIGFLLLVFPGLVLKLMFAVAIPVVVIENRGPVAALERSAQLTKGNRVLILFAAALLWLIVYVAEWLTSDYGATVPGPEGMGTSFFTSFVYAAVNQILTSAFTVLSLYLYLGLRAEKGETVSIYDAVAAPAAPARN